MQTAGAWRGWQAGGLEKPLIKAPQTCSHGLLTSASQCLNTVQTPDLGQDSEEQKTPRNKSEREVKGSSLREGIGESFEEQAGSGLQSHQVFRLQASGLTQERAEGKRNAGQSEPSPWSGLSQQH